MKCPNCGHENCFIFEQDALIRLSVDGFRIGEMYTLEDISLLESGCLTCIECSASSDENEEIETLYEKMMEAQYDNTL